MPTVSVTFQPQPGLPAAGSLVVHDPALDADELTEACHRLHLPEGRPATTRLAVPGPEGVEVREVGVRAIGLADALPALLAVSLDRLPAYRRPPDALRVWALAARAALRTVAMQRLVPGLVRSDGQLHGVWRGIEDPEGAGLLRRLAGAMPPSDHCLAVDDERVAEPLPLLEAFRDAIVDLAVRTAVESMSGRPRERLLPWTSRWAEALTHEQDPVVPVRDGADEILADVASWHQSLEADTAAVLELHLEAPTDEDAPWPLTLHVRGDDGRLRNAAEVWRSEPALAEPLLRELAVAARLFEPLDSAMRGEGPEGIMLDRADAWTFLDRARPLLEEAGVVTIVPDDLAREELAVRLRVDAPASVADKVDLGGDQPVASLHWEVTVAGEVLEPSEVDAILSADGPLIRWRGRWIALDEERRARLSGLGADTELGLLEALATSLAGGQTVTLSSPDGQQVTEEVEVVADGGIADLVDRIRAAGERALVPVTPGGFVGELREYQRRGVSWLAGMAELGLGAILADDMGLGKTVQLIAHLLGRGPDPGPCLIVCPTSVVGNWERELARFAPGLRITRFHGPQRPATLDESAGIVVTSYGTLRREVDTLAQVEWDVVTLDEAQQVKNPSTAGAKAVRRLHAHQTVAMTGTPLENRVDELWTLLDATNSGILGSRARFQRQFGQPVERHRDPVASRRLRRLVAPFVLRREKADPAVIADLPDKIERTVMCGLTPEQATLYEQAVERALGQEGDGAVAGATGIGRRGRVLALLTALKQVCNHPAQYLRETPAPVLRGRSGKLAVARQIIGEAAGVGDQILVFTQFVEMGQLLVRQFGEDLDTFVPFLHGGTPSGQRDRMVGEFQAGAVPVLVVSLRAGGTGLNLTAANHVVHYDRWWNPAVEDQATDRAHRIGQMRTVEVHKLVTSGTLEERIDAMLERKRDLAEAVVGAGETWLGELDDAELHELVALSAAQVEELDDDEDPWEEAG